MDKTVTLVTFRLYGTEIRPLGDSLTIPQSVDYVRNAMNVWDYFIFATKDDSVGIVFIDRNDDICSVVY
jgi:hypothetical protein